MQTTADCKSCHSTTAWIPATGFDHAGITNNCVSCHNGTTATGTVNFLNGLNPNGDETYFSLERNPNDVGQFLTTGVPEPATVTMLGMGVASLFGYGWRRRKTA